MQSNFPRNPRRLVFETESLTSPSPMDAIVAWMAGRSAPASMRAAKVISPLIPLKQSKYAICMVSARVVVFLVGPFWIHYSSVFGVATWAAIDILRDSRDIQDSRKRVEDHARQLRCSCSRKSVRTDRNRPFGWQRSVLGFIRIVRWSL